MVLFWKELFHSITTFFTERTLALGPKGRVQRLFTFAPRFRRVVRDRNN
jgi:hypothetical protein